MVFDVKAVMDQARKDFASVLLADDCDAFVRELPLDRLRYLALFMQKHIPAEKMESAGPGTPAGAVFEEVLRRGRLEGAH